jgi:alkanesulfonate monooxygenase SsuD/methylene tetrahydromethanopterin reductase-like flavin-dependent oxidoreductase (luciferase family)
MAKNSNANPRLRLCAAAWTMTNYPSAEQQWSFDEKVKAAKDAGFEGFSAGAAPEIAQACARHGMELVGGVDVGTPQEAEEKLARFKEAGAVHLNVQLCDHDTAIPKAVTVARKVMEVGKALKIKPAIEWHRDTVTETPEKAMALAAQYEKRYGQKLRMNFDHSHPAIIKQLRPANFWERISEYRLDLLRMSELIHFRTFTGSHCQTPITDGRGALDPDFVAWRDHFLRPMLAAWLKGQRSSRQLWAVVELGPKGSGYALACFPDVWQDAIVARGEIERVWQSALAEWRA